MQVPSLKFTAHNTGKNTSWPSREMNIEVKRTRSSEQWRPINRVQSWREREDTLK
jgi:hypothetical protein